MNSIRKTIMNHLIIILLVTGLMTSLSSCDPTSQQQNISVQELEKGFKEIPDDIQTSVYWYWISDNLSKEGVIKDLESMKAVGINRAFIGNIGLPPADQPYGTVKLFSDEWWDILHTALKKAGELNIEIGIFNSPGWSQSGGPWIKPEQSMRYLNTSKVTVEGPQQLSLQLAKPAEIFQDYKTLACRIDKEQTLNTSNTRISSTPQLTEVTHLMDKNEETELNLGTNNELTLLLETDEKQPIRSIIVTPAHRPIDIDVDIQVKEGETYKTIKRFNVNRTNPSSNVGFNPYGEVVMSLPETNEQSYKIHITNRSHNAGIREISLSSAILQERYVEKSLAKMFQSPLPYWHDYLWEAQSDNSKSEGAIAKKDILDISEFVDKNGLLTWEAPEGNWLILRTGMSPTGVTNGPASAEGVGLEVDKMSTEHVLSHFDAFLGEIIQRIPAEDRKTWKVVVQDSYETGGQNWTDKLKEDFTTQYGYDPTPFIPALSGYVVENRDITDRFLWDLRRLIADKVAYDYVGGLRDISHKHGLTTWLENYGHWGFPGEFLQYGGQSDEIGGEFWSEGELGDIENKAASSCAHIYGKKKVSAESFTCAGGPFTRHPYRMKQRGDRFFAEGINNTLLHVYIQQAYEDKEPGMNAWFGNEFNRKNTWFYDMDVFVDYLKRCNFMLQQGTYIADVAYFIGEDTPKMTGVRNPEIPKGYSYDYMNAEVILKYLTVQNGLLTLPSGIQYKVLVLPELNTMRPEVLQKIRRLTEAGGVILGNPPSISPSYENYPAADEEVKKLANILWGDMDGVNKKHHNVGKGIVASGMSLEELFELLSVTPDFNTHGANIAVEFIHRQLNNGEAYFITNQEEKEIQFTASFRVDGLTPELWDPVTGTTRILPQYTVTEGTTTIDLRLHPLESAFIVFRPTSEVKANPSGVNYPPKEASKILEGSWSVQFDPARRGPAEPVIMNELKDWTQFEDDNIKYFSGDATYTKTFDYTEDIKNKRVFIRLNPLTSIAEVKINSQSAGKIWTAPWEIDITDYLQKEDNILEIRVVNNWVNRLIGDARLPEGERKTWAPVNLYNGTEGLQPSGLTGPVEIFSVHY